MNLSEPFIRRPVMTAVLTLSVILFGLMSYSQLPVNDLPTVDYPVIQVVVGYPGASPDTIANNIATPLERQFMQINGLEVVTSSSTQFSPRTVSVPPSGIASRALTQRLSRTWCSWVGFAATSHLQPASRSRPAAP